MITPMLALAGIAVISAATPHVRSRTPQAVRAAIIRAGMLRCAAAAAWAVVVMSALLLETSLPAARAFLAMYGGAA